AGDDEHVRLLHSVDAQSVLSVPLISRNGTIGVLSLFRRRGQRPFDRADQAVAEDLAQRAVLSIDNAALFRHAQNAITFVGVAGHELRTPLSAAQLLVERLALQVSRGQEPLAPTKAKEVLDRARHQMQRLTDLLRYLMDVTQLASDRPRLALEE